MAEESSSDLQLTQLSVLILEDEPADAELMQRALKKDGLPFTATVVATKAAFIAALEASKPDILLTDFNLPDFNGLAAIKLAHDKYPELPIVVVTGVLGDETAVGLIKAGAMDYVLKDRLARLPAAVKRAAHDAAQSRLLRKDEEAIRTAEKNLYAIVTYSQDAILMTDERMAITFWNKSAETCFGYAAKEMIGRDIYTLLANEQEAQSLRRQVGEFIKGGGERLVSNTYKLHIRKKDGEVSSHDLSVSFIRLEKRWSVVGIVRPQSIQF